MPISSFGILISLITYFLFPQHVFAQIPKEDDKQIVFNTQNEKFTSDGLLASEKQKDSLEIKVSERLLVSNGALLAANDPTTTITKAKDTDKKPAAVKTYVLKNGPVVIETGREYQVVATAYSSTVDQTDSSPFITASGTHVHDGTLATNFLKFGTKVTIPDIYGEKTFTVEDRMRDNHKVDVWFPSREQALKFGVKRTRIVVVD